MLVIILFPKFLYQQHNYSLVEYVPGIVYLKLIVPSNRISTTTIPGSSCPCQIFGLRSISLFVNMVQSPVFLLRLQSNAMESDSKLYFHNEEAALISTGHVRNTITTSLISKQSALCFAHERISKLNPSRHFF